MKNLVHVYNNQHSHLNDYAYSLLPQRAFLQRLSDCGIIITSQTLRNWEQNNLLTPQLRSGQPEKRGLRVAYSEFALAEAFTVYSLSNSKLSFNLADNYVPFPKYSLLHIEMARRAFCESRCTIPNFPKPPESSYTIRYRNPLHEELFKALPPFNFIFKKEHWKVTIPQIMSCDEIAKCLFFQGLYSAWFFAMNKGCESFFSNKKNTFVLP